MAFLQVGSQVINTAHIIRIALHFDPTTFHETVDDATARPARRASVVRVYMVESHEPLTFFGAEAHALHEHFADPKHGTLLIDATASGA